MDNMDVDIDDSFISAALKKMIEEAFKDDIFF